MPTHAPSRPLPSPPSPATDRPRQRGQHGHSLVELIVLLAAFAIIATLSWPALQRFIVRSNLEGAARESAILVQKTRLEAVRNNGFGVVRMDTTEGTIQAFVDRHGTNPEDPPDLVFNPIGTEIERTTDFEVGSYEYHGRVTFGAPGSQDTVDGLTTNSDGVTALVFRPDGSAVDIGAFRFQDETGTHFLEVRVDNAATGRVVVRKWNPADSTWKSQREDGESWSWKS